MGYIRSLAPGISAEDVLQETNITLWDKMENFEHGTNFRAYASKIAYLKTMEAIRQNKRNQWLLFDSDILEHINQYHGTNADSKKADADQNALRHCLKKLPPKERDLIHQRYTLGHSIRSIAKAMEKTEGSMQQAFFRIRSSLKTCITKQSQEQL